MNAKNRDTVVEALIDGGILLLEYLRAWATPIGIIKVGVAVTDTEIDNLKWEFLAKSGRPAEVLR